MRLIITRYKAKRKLISFLIATVFLFASFFAFLKPANINAQTTVWDQISVLQSEMASLNNQIQAEQGKINSYKGQINGDQSLINNLQDIISQKQQLITDKQSQIDLLQQSITEEQTQINDLNTKINNLYALFVARAKVSYENSYVNPFMIAIGNQSIDDVFANLEYFTTTRNQDSQILSELKNDSYILKQKLDDLSKQESDLLAAQQDLINQKSGLQSQQDQLQSQVNYYSYQNSRLQTQLNANQQAYAQLVAQINSLQVASFGGTSNGCVSGNWWYYNQQCYGRLPGANGTSINMTYGCLITDIAMVATKEIGPQYTPPYIASISIFSNNYWEGFKDAFPLSPTPLGYQNMSAIDAQIAAGFPVIVYLNAPLGEHWVVFFGKTSSGDYIINDPWYGSSLTFLGTGNGTHEYYSISEIGESFILR